MKTIRLIAIMPVRDTLKSSEKLSMPITKNANPDTHIHRGLTLSLWPILWNESIPIMKREGPKNAIGFVIPNGRRKGQVPIGIMPNPSSLSRMNRFEFAKARKFITNVPSKINAVMEG
jgi:hypothetical protein